MRSPTIVSNAASAQPLRFYSHAIMCMRSFRDVMRTLGGCRCRLELRDHKTDVDCEPHSNAANGVDTEGL